MSVACAESETDTGVIAAGISDTDRKPPRRQHLGPERGVLEFQIEKRDFHGKRVTTKYTKDTKMNPRPNPTVFYARYSTFVYFVCFVVNPS